MLNKIKEFLCKNRDEIIDSVTTTKQSKKHGKKKQAEIEEKIKREHKAVKVPLIIGIIYVFVGAVLLRYLIQNDLFIAEPRNVVIGFELIILGTYSLLHTLIFYCVLGRWSGKCIVKFLKAILIVLMLPYHLCIKGIKAFIKDKRQEHVMYLFPYYLISLLIVMFSFNLALNFISRLEISEAYNEVVSFIIVCCLILEFFGFGKFFAYFITKFVIKSVQKSEIKKISKINWRGTMKDDKHKEERRNKFNDEWTIVKKELEYTKIYFYIILTVLVLWIPKKDNSLAELLVNQFLGITAIAALARESKTKKAEDDLESV